MSGTPSTRTSRDQGPPLGAQETVRSVKWLKARKKGEHASRLVDRGGPFHQSIGRWNIRRLKGQADLKKLVVSDPFHTLIDQSTLKIILSIIGVYLSLVLVFAIVYTIISATLGCNLGLTGIREGFLFSLETMTTVGYGTHDYLFGTCWVMLPMLSLQACTGLLIDAFLIGILFARLSRPQTRANTVVFTKNAVIRRVRGEAYFMFQVGELRKHQLLETRVRCYALRHERLTSTSGGSGSGGNGDGKGRADSGSSSIGNSRRGSRPRTSGIGATSSSVSSGTGIDMSSSNAGAGPTSAELASKMPDQVFFQSHYMRLQHPDDELGGNLLLVLPQTVVHRIDAWSPMMPPPRWNSSHGLIKWGLHTDKDIVQAPWEVPTTSLDHVRDASDAGSAAAAAATAAGTAAAAAATAAADAADVAERGGSLPPGGFEKLNTSFSAALSTDGQHSEQGDESDGASRRGSHVRPSTSIGYWDDASASEFGVSVHEKGAADDDDTNNLGYVHRFPDLLKRWDDVDGDRGTWYEKMKRRVLKVEMERRQAEDARKQKEKGGKTASEVRAAASQSRLARAGFWQKSIMQIGGGATKPTNESTESLGADRRKKETSSMSKLSEGLQAPQGGGGKTGKGGASGDQASVASGTSGGGGQFLSAGQWFAREEKKAIDAYVQDRELEVVVIVEGTDTSTGSTVQARHSYCWEDILWDRTFASCVTRGEDGACEVDFSKFHDTLQAPANCEDHGFIQSYA